jgi:phosphopantetheinyl transferase
MARLESVLSVYERDKAARFRRDADRSSSIAARGALRILLSGYTGMPAAEIEFSIRARSFLSCGRARRPMLKHAAPRSFLN